MFPFMKPAMGNEGGEPLPRVYGTEPIRATRHWLVTNDEGYRLASIHLPYIWGRHNTAVCIKRNQEMFKHKAPDLDCQCGLYAERPGFELKEWQTQSLGRVSAYGTVELWGRIIQCDMGYKAEYAALSGSIWVKALCKTECSNEVTTVTLPMRGAKPAVYCPVHAPEHEPSATMDVAVFLEEAAKQLSTHYDVDVWLM